MMRKSFYSFFFLLVVVISAFHPGLPRPATGEAMVGQTESRACKSPSQGFHGLCVSAHNCAIVCRDEGFERGECDGFRRRCMCTKQC